MNAAKHNHEALPFGRKVAEGCCPRCDELRAGAAPKAGYRNNRAAADKAACLAIHAHDCKASGCGFVCTFGSW